MAETNYDLIGTRDSTVSPGTTEYYNTQSGIGFESPQMLSNFFNVKYGGNTTADNIFSTISTNQLSPATSLTVPTATPQADALAPAAASATETTKSLDQYIKELTPPQTETSKQYDSLLGELNTLLPGLTGRGEAQINAETQAGLPDLKKRLSDINAQLLQKVAEATKLDTSYEQMIANLENPNNVQQQGIPMSAIIGQQAQVKKMQLADHNAKAADLGLLQAFALGLQGQVGAAQSAVDRAIDLKYQDRQATVDLKMQQLKLLEGKLNKEEEVTRMALDRKYREEQQAIEEEKAKAKSNINLAIENGLNTKFVNKNGEFFRTSDGKTYGSAEEFFKDAGVTSFEEAYRRGLVGDLDANKIYERDSTRAIITDLIAKYPDAGITVMDSLETAQSKLKNSRIYQDQIRPPQGPGGSVTERLLSSQQTILQGARNLSRGKNGLANPNDYLDKASEYIGASGGVKDFLAAVTPERYLSSSDAAWVRSLLEGNTSSGIDPVVAAYLGLQ